MTPRKTLAAFLKSLASALLVPRPSGRLCVRALIVLMTAGLIAAFLDAAGSPAPVARVVVWKKANSASPSDSFFVPVVSAKPAAAGFSQVADYPSRTLFRGPKAAAAQLINDLKTEGFDVQAATDLDSLNFHDYTIDADTGQVAPKPAAIPYTPTGTEGLYFLSLEGYPTDSWSAELAAKNIRVLEGLPPSSLLVRGDRALLEALPTSTSYVRGVFSLTPSLKRVLFAGTPTSEAFQWVSIMASEEGPADSIEPFLDSVSQEPVVVTARAEGKAMYEALLSEIDIATLVAFENVYSVSPTRGAVSLSSERQAVLITRTDLQAGTLPTTSPDYVAYLTAPGKLTWSPNTFSNTVVGMVDTGFDNGDISMAGIQPDFKFTFGGVNYTTLIADTFSPSFANGTDEDAHGTITASVITGYATAGTRGENGYRYALGTAPTVHVAMDKFLKGGVQGGTLVQSLDGTPGHPRLNASSPNVVNMSWNTKADAVPSGCAYTTDSQTVDLRTRDPKLFTNSAGNGNLSDSTEDCSPNYVRAPATSKNGIAVGATENYTIAWTTLNGAGTCLYNGYPPVHCTPVCAPQDARNVAYYSAQRDPQSMVKPDLVAPGSRITGPFTRGTLLHPPYGIACNTSIDPANPSYAFSAGTSFAAPAVAGASAVVRKWFRNLKATDPSPAMTKAILINGARDVAGAWVRNENFVNQTQIGHIPDPFQGWGMLSLDRLLGPASQYYFFDQGLQLSPSGVWNKTLFITSAARPTHVTLVWTDPSMTPTTHYKITNNLELQACAASCLSIYYSNIFNSFGYTSSGVVNHDSFNNVEQIIIAPNSFSAGTPVYLVISAASVMTGNQDFAIIVDNAHE